MCDTITKTCNLTVVVKRSIKEIPEEEWDSIIGIESLYRSHRFLLSVENSNSESASFWYIMMYDNQRLMASAVCSCFRVSLDMFMSSFFQDICNAIRHVYKLFLRPKMLFCGLPISIGKHTISISPEVPEKVVIENIRQKMEEIAQKYNIKYKVVKEFTEEASKNIDMLKDYDYIKAESVPKFKLDIRWNSIDEYLNSMRHCYRRNILKSLNYIGNSKLLLNHTFSQDSNSYDKPFLNVRKIESHDVPIFHDHYKNVMKRVDKKMEILNLEFFEELSKNMHSDLRLISLEDSKTSYGTVLLAENRSTLYFLLIGLDYNFRDDFNTYYNLLYGIVGYAIENGFETVDLGQTTSFAKRRYGAVDKKMYFYIKAKNQLINIILFKFRRYIFPGNPSNTLHVFKAN